MIYVDYNATAPTLPAVARATANALEKWGNPSSSHRLGREARAAVEQAREQVAQVAQVRDRDITFTSGGSEANHLACLGAFFQTGPGFRLLTTPVEHSSIGDLLPVLTKLGAEVKTLPVRLSGELDEVQSEALIEEFRPHLVSVMAANNETGVLYPILKIADWCQAAGATLHTDAVQALGKVPAEQWNPAPLISISAHKLGGPKGVGALIVQNGIKLSATHFGGSQETKRRGGTENVPGIVGFGEACAQLPQSNCSEARNRFESLIQRELTGTSILGGSAPRLDNTSCIRFAGIRAEILLSNLDLDGVFVSVGSACSSGSVAPSHVLLAMGLEEEAAREAVRFSWGPSPASHEVDTVATLVIKHVLRIRERRQSR